MSRINENDEYPPDYTCPITMDLMLNPVKASDGYIYFFLTNQ